MRVKQANAHTASAQAEIKMLDRSYWEFSLMNPGELNRLWGEDR